MIMYCPQQRVEYGSMVHNLTNTNINNAGDPTVNQNGRNDANIRVGATSQLLCN